MSFIVSKYRNRLAADTTHYFINELSTIEIANKKGTIFPVVAYRTGATANEWYFGIPYKGSQITAENLANNFDTSVFIGSKYYQETKSVNTLARLEYSGNSRYNAERQLGILTFNGFNASGTSVTFFSARNNNWQYAVDAQLFIVNYGSTTDSDFWDKVENGAKGRIPWQEATSTTGGGEGKWNDDATDPVTEINPENLNSNSIGRTFFASTYRLGFGALQLISSKLWSTSFLDWAKQFFSNPMEGIISLNLIPYAYGGDSTQSVVIGSYDTEVVGSLIFNQFQKLDCGEIEIPEKWGSAIDYKSRVTLYLPFIGSHDLDSSEVIGAKLHIYYIIDMMTGSCVANVKVKRGDLDSVLYQFNGNCAYNLPISQNNYSTLLSSMLSASASVAVGVATGGASTPLMVGAGASVASDARPHVAHSGNLSANVGYMGIKKPYVILTRPQQALPADFGKYKGYQSHITKKLSECKGFTKVEEIHLGGITATADELAEIERLLKDGVII